MPVNIPKWFSLLAAFIGNGIVWGSLYSFSVLYSHLRDLHPEHEMHISLTGSLLFGISMGGSLLMAPLMRRVTLRWLYFSVLILYALGPIMSAFVPDVRFWYLTYTIPVGLGGAGMSILSYVTAAMCYPTRVCAASTVVSMGSSVFSAIIPILMELLIQTYGIQISLSILSGILLSFLVLTPGYPSITTSQTVEEPTNNAAFSMQVGSVISLCQIDRNISPTLSFKKILLSRDFVIWVITSILHLSFNNIGYVHLTNYTKHLTDNSMASPMFFMVALGVGATISKILYAILIEKFNFPVFLAVQLTLTTFGLGLSLIGLLEFFTDDTAIIIVLYISTFLLGFGEGPIWSLGYPATYETCKPHIDPTIFCIYSGFISVPFCLGGPIGTAIYQYTRSYPLAYYVAACGYLVASNILWFSSQTNYSKKRKTEPNIELRKNNKSYLIVEEIEQSSQLLPIIEEGKELDIN